MVTAPVEPLTQARGEATYWKTECHKVIKERDALKLSLVAQDGPAAFWRDQAKQASSKLADAQRRLEGVRKGEREQREHAIRFSEEVDTQKRHVGTVKQQLWELWTALEDGPLKQQLWEVWTAL